MNIIMNSIILILAVLLTSYILPGVKVASLGTAIIVALLIGLLNVFVKPFILLITLPINILTFGLFTFVINAFIILITSFLSKGFMVDNFWWALLFSIVLSMIAYILEVIFT
ncbi:MAG: phage holin family protein [Candidatus Pacebacteria bacterium]|nr:phage holin family protein [Candidatus Paceibacterota bacterium]